MNTTNRRTEIMNILILRRHTTARELAEESGSLHKNSKHCLRIYAGGQTSIFPPMEI